MPISLHKDLASGGWHCSIATTYSVDPQFYDLYMERRLRSFGGSDNNILMADARMLKIALDAMPEGFAAAGTRYAVLPVKVAGAFHPKLHLRLGERKARLVVGSANATARGWGRNQEIVASLDWRLGAEDAPDNDAMGGLTGRAVGYLMRWLSAAPGESIRYKLQLLRRKSPWLQDLEPRRGPIDLSDGTAIDLLCESGGDSPSIFRQFTTLAKADEVRRLVVISPYWDSSLNGLQMLRRTLGSPQTFIAINPHSGEFPLGALPKKDDLKFVALEGDNAERFLHAKVFVVETREADHVLFGSANCSDDALGQAAGPARNAEACLYRRLPARAALGELGIDLRKTLPRESISVAVAQANRTDEGTSVPPGEMEVVARTLTWWPPAGVNPKGAAILIKEAKTAPQPVSPAKWIAELAKPPEFPVVARVAYADGRVSDPVIVHGTARLRRAAPSDINAALSDALARVRKGDADLLELALQAHVIFAPDPQSASAPGSARSAKNPERAERAVQYATPEEFRNAVALREASGKSGLFAYDDPGLQEVLSIVLRGINAARPEDDAGLDVTEDDADLLAGDTEDEDEPADGEEESTDKEGPKPPEQPAQAAKTFTPEEVLQRRAYLLRALDRFHDLLRDLSESPSKITTRIAGQALFFLWLIRYGCRFDHPGVTQGPRRLMVLCPGTESERDYSFVLRAMRILNVLWRGKNAIASHITADPRHGELHDDLYGLAVHSRWALARSYLLALDHGDASLAQHIAKAALEILPATHRLGPVDAEAERETMTQLDLDLGCVEKQTEALLRCCQEFETAAKLKIGSALAATAGVATKAVRRK